MLVPPYSGAIPVEAGALGVDRGLHPLQHGIRQHRQLRRLRG
jgi:hypothetical protein